MLELGAEPQPFIQSERASSGAPEANVGVLVRHCAPVSPEACANDVCDRFNKDKSLQLLPVVNVQQQPVGLVSRRDIIETYSRPYMHDLYRHKTIASLMQSAPIMADRNDNLDDLASEVASSPELTDGFIITDQGKYVGVGSARELFHEVVSRKQSHLYRLAHFDELTGLPNRNLFLERLEQACADLGTGLGQVAVLFVDLDRFKYINDTLGHSAGDSLLRMVADRLTDEAEEANTIARLGGDEFTLILDQVLDLHSVVSVIKRVINRLREPFVIQGRAFTITASIGVATAASPEQNIDDLIRKADTAMFHAKDRGKNTFKFYRDSLSERAGELLQLEHCLRGALKNQEFSLAYQPIIDGATGSVVSVESLLRWHSPELGFIGPDKFIPLAEELGLIKELGYWVLEQACHQLVLWRAQGLNLQVAVNVSGRQIDGDRFVEEVAEVLLCTGAVPRELKLEVTESFILERPNAAIAALDKIKAMGVGIALDDFGTGYSSMNYLKRLPIDELKIDRSFVNEITDNPQDEAIVRAITMMAHSMDIKIVAEGVETLAHVNKLQQLACDRMQGYYFAKPLPAEDVPDFVRSLDDTVLGRLHSV